jgi:DNA excision repair protein ERCC-4
VARLQSVLEGNPKWRLLKQILTEIREEVELKKMDSEAEVSDGQEGPIHVLVMVKDEKALESTKAYLTDGKDRSLMLKWLRYLEQVNDRSRSITGASSMSEESRLLLEEEGRARRLLFGNGKRKADRGGKDHRLLNQVPGYVRKRRRVAAEMGRGESTGQSDDLARQAILEEAVEVTEHDMGHQEGLSDGARRPLTSIDKENASIECEESMFRVSYSPGELRVVLKSYKSIENDRAYLCLRDIRPQYVVLFDADVAFIRSLEVYAALPTHVDPLRVFFLMFQASSEEKNFKKSMEQEQTAFEHLIHHKKTMPPPVLQSLETQEMQQAFGQSSVAGTYMGGTLPLAVDTRRGRGKSNKSKESRDIAVDVREFRSALPSILHHGGMRLAPVTLTVGDFVLSNIHCVERKSVSDLFGSFASGRLYAQAEAMCKHYKCPCLLIEFDPTKSFCLQNSNELGGDIKMDSVSTKLALLTMHFPKLRILWSRGPYETLKIFRGLKANHEEVDVDKAVEIGRQESEDALLQPDDAEDEINEVARDMLLRLPGVNVHIARKIMRECDTLAELSELSRDELRRIAGPAAGQKLFTFFRQKIGSS